MGEEALMPEYLQWVITVVHKLGYPGIFLATFLESTFLPVPSEITMIPAGYLIYKGEWHWLPVLALSILGTVAGSLFNYYLALRLGRPFLMRYKKYFFLNDTKIYKIETFFAKHGEISTLSGRLVPGLRHLISVPAGLARMDVRRFCLFTAIGGGIWMVTLMAVGYFIGGKEELVREYTPKVVSAGIAMAVIAVTIYIVYVKHIAKHPKPIVPEKEVEHHDNEY